MFKRIDHVEIVPTDAERTINFYVDIIGFKIQSRNEINMPPMKEVIYLKLGDTVIEIMSIDNPEPKSEAPWKVGYRALALEVEDMSKAVAYMESKKIPITWGPADLGEVLRAEIQDPDGLIIELRQWKKQSTQSLT
ncbi:VOC family protein [Maridesulfovibrio sp.]|uniref:VOC family protein n=1 Tax=Maridesulfovibrio sp. TaxID=2795000 RepID=UPI002A18862E|nr:VOC family protein [Maridesulfovibrio sp.]